MSEMISVEKMPVLALRGIVIFPEQTLHFDIAVLSLHWRWSRL